MLGDSAEMAYLSYMANRLRECRRVLKPTGSIYLHCDPTMNYLLRMVMNAIFETKNFKNQIIWHYRKWPVGKYTFQRNHDVILFYSRSDNRLSAFNQLYMPRTESTRKRFGTKRIVSGYDDEGQRLPSVTTDEESEGVRLDDVWDIARVHPDQAAIPDRETAGSAGAHRFPSASSNPGDVVFESILRLRHDHSRRAEPRTAAGSASMSA